MSIEINSELGKKSSYISTYNPALLYAIPRLLKREEIGVDSTKLPFYGFDLWNHYEVSWLNPKGKPVIALAKIIYDCQSPHIIESKSLKLYFNSFNNTSFASKEVVENVIKNDLEQAIEHAVDITIHEVDSDIYNQIAPNFEGINLDTLDVDCSIYTVNPAFLSTESYPASEALYSNLLKSNCLVTNQPDWGSLSINYTGMKINHEGLLQYIISFRNHNEFHEQCVERIFIDIMTYCNPTSLTVYARYTRRGGLDINPYRSTESALPSNTLQRLVRQ